MINYTILEGTVTTVNDKGFKLDNEATWLNPSKFAKPAPMMPAKGDRVRVTLDNAGFVRYVEPARGPVVEESAADKPVVEASATTEDRRQVLIVRQACIKAACELATVGGMTDNVQDVLSIAEQLEAWVLR